MAEDRSAAPSLGSVAIVGAGVSGLAAAYKLQAAGVAVTILEAEPSAGGKIQSFSEDGFIWEKGPNTMMENDHRVSRLIDELGIRSKQQLPVLQKKRYIVRNGTPVPLPSGPLSFITTSLLSTQAKLGVLFEPFLWKKPDAEAAEDESVGSFMERHFGREVVDYAVDPFVAGTSGSDPFSISARHSFPGLWTLEKNHGSFLLGAVKSKFTKPSQNKPRVKGSFSFSGGLQILADALLSRIGERNVKLNSVVTGLSCSQQGNPSRENWKVTSLVNRGKQSSEQFFDAVVMTTPLNDFKTMKVVKRGKPYDLGFLPKVIYEPVSVLITLFQKDSVKRPLSGFGLLVPSKEQANGFQTLGTLFSSSMFPDRAPRDHLLFTTFVGGSRNMPLASSSKDELLEVVCKDLSKLLGVEGRPQALRHVYWSKAFPRYNVGYSEVLSSIERLETELPGLFYAGNQRGGLAVGKAILSGFDAAEQVLLYIRSSGGRKLYTMASVS